MPTRNIVLTSRQDEFIERLVSTGRYQNASEVLRAGIRLIERMEAEDGPGWSHRSSTCSAYCTTPWTCRATSSRTRTATEGSRKSLSIRTRMVLSLRFV